MTGYIYSLHGKTEGDIFYVGATVNPKKRLLAHRCNFPYYLRDCHPTLSIIEEIEFTEKSELNKIEYYWIHQFACWGFNLVNYNLFYGVDIRSLRLEIEIEKEPLPISPHMREFLDSWDDSRKQ